MSQSGSPNRADVWLLLEWEFVRVWRRRICNCSFVFGHGRSRLFLPFLLPNLAAPFNPDPDSGGKREGILSLSPSPPLHLFSRFIPLWQLMELQLQ